MSLRRAKKREKDERRRLEEKKHPQYATCPDCGGYMSWCSFCECYTKTCCVDYGTCMCS